MNSKLLNIVLLASMALFISGCVHHIEIDPDASSKGNHYSCNRPIKFDDSMSDYSVVANKFDVWTIKLGPVMSTKIKNTFANKDDTNSPIVISFGDQTSADFGTTVFNDNIVKVELTSNDKLLPSEQQIKSYVGKAGKPTGFLTAMSGMLGQIGIEALYYPKIKRDLTESANLSLQNVLTQLEADLVSRGVCQPAG